jgi:hypothetical protein
VSPAPPPDEAYRAITRAFACVIAGFGIAIIVVTLAHGGTAGSGGIWMGLVFTGLGLGRLYLSLRRGTEE